MTTKSDTRHKAETGRPKPETKHPKGPWPDGEAREEMSREESDRDNLGKHSKNADWGKKW